MNREYTIQDTIDYKKLRSPGLNYNFDKNTGNMETWGALEEDDPQWSPFGPFIVDMEITTICKGPGGKLCPFCYKSNTSNGRYMTFETFKEIFHKLPDVVTQIAFGADATLETNPDVWDIMQYCRDNGVIPNVTVADITEDTAKKLTKVCGAVAVSRYADKSICYDSVKRLVDAGMKQVNIHMMISKETFSQAVETVTDIDNDPRLRGMNAIVFLSLKNKGRGEKYSVLSQKEFTKLVYFTMAKNIRFGFDSCSCHSFLKSVKNLSNYDSLYRMAEPCESGLFSAYIDVSGNFYPCSFCEGTEKWKDGISVLEYGDFINDVWKSNRILSWNDNLLSNKRDCPIYIIR